VNKNLFNNNFKILFIMKKSLFVAAIAALAVVACKKSETTETPAADSTAVAADSAAVDSTAAFN
jgi:hypothetical protein